jgi:site-specific DNA-adenine methylase
MIYIVIYTGGHIELMPVKLAHLPEYLRELYEPYSGKILEWNHIGIKEWQG